MITGSTLQSSYTLSDIGNEMHQFWQFAHQYRVLAFNGEMGAGKTTFIHALCNYLGVKDAVTSPTYALINEYHFTDNLSGADRTIYHIDLYRLKGRAEAIEAGIEDCLLQKNAYCFVEWAEKAPELLPKPYLLINIETPDPIDAPETRKLLCKVIS